MSVKLSGYDVITRQKPFVIYRGMWRGCGWDCVAKMRNITLKMFAEFVGICVDKISRNVNLFVPINMLAKAPAS